MQNVRILCVPCRRPKLEQTRDPLSSPLPLSLRTQELLLPSSESMFGRKRIRQGQWLSAPLPNSQNSVLYCVE